MYNHNKAQQSKNRVHISWDILYISDIWGGLLHYIMVPAPSSRMTRVCETPCWNRIRDSHTVLKPYDLTCWQVTSIRNTDVLSWIPIFNHLVDEKYFSVPAERHRFFKSHDITLHASFHWHDKCHYEKLEHVIVMITWSENVTIGGKTISGLNYIM